MSGKEKEERNMKQKVVRTYPPHPGYKDDTTGLRDLRAMLEAGYRVVMANTVSCNGCEWLEYILEREAELR